MYDTLFANRSMSACGCVFGRYITPTIIDFFEFILTSTNKDSITCGIKIVRSSLLRNDMFCESHQAVIMDDLQRALSLAEELGHW